MHKLVLPAFWRCGQEATYLCWCGPLPLLDVFAANSLAAEVAVRLLGLTGFYLARSDSGVSMGLFVPAGSDLPNSLDL